MWCLRLLVSVLLAGSLSVSWASDSVRSPQQLASPFVPLDSWVYAAFDRLAALGYAPSAYADLRPWTRMECARILVAASRELYIDEKSGGEAYRLYAALKAEFADELRPYEGLPAASSVRIENLYTRYLGIAGTPLDDSYHFGQTLINDFGRPYGEGSNLVSGFEASASSGPAVLFIRGEYQHAGAMPPFTPAIEQLLGTIDLTPPVTPNHTSVLNQFRLLDSYLAWNFKTIQFSAGRQSLWWGPGLGGPPNFSDNAEPMDMLRATNPSPWRLPSFFSWLGPMRWEFFIGLMGEHHFPELPAMDGQKISLKPTPNLEFGFSRTIVFKPITFGQFWKGFISVGNNSHTLPGSIGNRHGGFDFSYRIPGLRNWLVLYSDGTSDHNPSPLGEPQMSLMNPGVYLPQIPKIPKLDFRAEVAWSDPPALANWVGRYFYYDSYFHISYGNDGNLIGSWVGREGHGLQLWSTYWLSPRNTLQFGYRKAHVDSNFIPDGGNIQDFSIRSGWRLRSDIEINTFFQYERWSFPVLAPLAGPDTVASIEVDFHPKWGVLQFH
jgi:Capsule assembly protein Wzi